MVNTNKKYYRLLAGLTAVLMFLCQIPNTINADDVVPVAEPVFYVDENGTGQDPITEYKVVTSETTTLYEGWNVVEGNVTIDQRISVEQSKTARLILCDGAKLTVNGGIEVPGVVQDSPKTNLEIYAQTGGTGTLIANSSQENTPGIGGGSGIIISIYGGIITANGSGSAPGIGSISVTETDINLSYPVNGKVSISSSSYGGDVILKKDFVDTIHKELYVAQTVSDNSVLVDTTLVPRYDVTFTINLKGGYFRPGYEHFASQTVEFGGKATDPVKEPNKDGFAFMGYYKDETLNEPFDFDEPIIEDTTVYVGWGHIVYVQAYNMSTNYPYPQDVDYGLIKIQGVSNDFEKYHNDKFFPDTQLTFVAQALPGYKFVDWRKSGSIIPLTTDIGTEISINAEHTVTIDSHAVYLARFKEAWYVTYDPNGGTTTNQSGYVDYNYQLTLPSIDTFVAPQNKEFSKYKVFKTGDEDNWQIIDPTNPGEVKSITIEADTTIQVLWEDIKFPIIVKTHSGDDSQGTIGIDVDNSTDYDLNTRISIGDSHNIVAFPAAGFEFDHWEWKKTNDPDDPYIKSSTSNPYVIEAGTYDKNVSLAFEAYFKQKAQYTVTFDPNNGTASTTAQVYSGDTVARPANPEKNGLTFDKWVDANGNEFNFSTPVTGNITLKAQYKGRLIVRHYNTSNGNYGSSLISANVYDNGEYHINLPVFYVTEGTSVTVNVQPDTGSMFDGWYDGYGGGETLISSDQEYTFTFGGNTTLWAHVKEAEYKVKLSTDKGIDANGEIKLNNISDYSSTSQSSTYLYSQITAGTAEATIRAKADDGYYFVEWRRSENDNDFENAMSFATENPYTFTLSEYSNYYLYAVFKKNPDLIIHWSSVDGEDLVDPVTITVEKGTKLYEALNGISQVYGGYEPFADAVEGYYQGWLYFYEKPYNYYIGQGKTASTMQTVDYVSENTVIDDDMDVYVLMDKPLGVAPEASIEAPLCGVETATGQKNRTRAVEWDWDSQTNRPAVTADGEHYQAEGYWIDDQTGENPYIGPFVGDETYYAFISLEADLGYYFDKNIEEVNGSEQLVNAENIKTSIDAVVTVKAVHDWDEPEYEWADDNSSVTARRVCKGDESHTETETVRTTSRIIKEATENETGIKSYKAVFTNPAFTEQTKNVDIPKTDGHGGKTGTYRVPKTGVETVLDMKIYKTQSESAGGK